MNMNNQNKYKFKAFTDSRELNQFSNESERVENHEGREKGRNVESPLHLNFLIGDKGPSCSFSGKLNEGVQGDQRIVRDQRINEQNMGETTQEIVERFYPIEELKIEKFLGMEEPLPSVYLEPTGQHVREDFHSLREKKMSVKEAQRGNIGSQHSFISDETPHVINIGVLGNGADPPHPPHPPHTPYIPNIPHTPYMPYNETNLEGRRQSDLGVSYRQNNLNQFPLGNPLCRDSLPISVAPASLFNINLNPPQPFPISTSPMQHNITTSLYNYPPITPNMHHIQYLFDKRMKLLFPIDLNKNMTVKELINELTVSLITKGYIPTPTNAHAPNIHLILRDAHSFEMDENSLLIYYDLKQIFSLEFKPKGETLRLNANGSFDLLDVPMRILDMKKANNQFVFKIFWKRRPNGTFPLETYVSEHDLLIHYPKLLYQFFANFAKSHFDP